MSEREARGERSRVPTCGVEVRFIRLCWMLAGFTVDTETLQNLSTLFTKPPEDLTFSACKVEFIPNFVSSPAKDEENSHISTNAIL